MTSRLSIRPMSQQEISKALREQAGETDAAQLQTLAQLVEQIDDALLVIEHPQLAARLLAARSGRNAA
jgi:hypothetical protein